MGDMLSVMARLPGDGDQVNAEAFVDQKPRETAMASIRRRDRCTGFWSRQGWLRGHAGAGLLAHIVVSKYDDHLPLYRQAEIFARDGVSLETSRLMNYWVQLMAGAVAIETKRLWGKARFSAGLTTKAVLLFPLCKFAHGGKRERGPRSLWKSLRVREAPSWRW
jgi:hypothetical protein